MNNISNIKALIDDYIKDNIEIEVLCSSSCSNIDFDDMSLSFNQLLFKYIDDKHLNEVDIYKKAYIDRKLFSKIRSNINYRPKKKTVVQLIFGLKLNIAEANELLNSAGYYLSHSLKSDLIVEWFIINNNYDLDLLFDCLCEYNEKI